MLSEQLGSTAALTDSSGAVAAISRHRNVQSAGLDDLDLVDEAFVVTVLSARKEELL